MKMIYIITPEIKKLGISKITVAEITGVKIGTADTELEKLKTEAAAHFLKMNEEIIIENPTLQSYRDLVKSIGRSPKKFPPAAESLLYLIKRNGRLPHINMAVDSYNIIAAKTGLAFGVHDMNKLSGTITFRLSSGPEPFRAVGSEHEKHTQAGDYVYADEKQVLAWLDSKDSDAVKLSLDTMNIVMIIQGTPYTKIEDTMKAAEEACSLITKFCGGKFEVSFIE